MKNRRVALTLVVPVGALALAAFSPSAGPLEPVPANPTYAEHIAPIFNRSCVECHRPGEVAPFSLIGYAEASKRAPMLAMITESRRMPPWKPVHGFGEFLDSTRLTDVEIATIKSWAANGAPRGDASKEPKTPEFSSEWALGKPDLILSNATPFKLEAEGADVYRNFVLKTSFKETRWVKAMDVKPGNNSVVHHVIAFIDEKGRSLSLEGRTKDGQAGYSTFGGPGFNPDSSFGGWAPGLRARHTPAGTAFRLEPGATVVMQVHYHLSGKPETDQTRLGLYFAKEPIEKEMRLAWMANPLFRIPAGAKEHEVKLNFPIPADITIHAVMPHMHLLGRSMKAEAVLPDSKTKPLVWINDWDFNWQMNYVLKDSLKLPRGSAVRVVGSYDNSSDNPYNPNHPPKPVTWGEETTDEMFLFIAAYTLDAERLSDGGGRRPDPLSPLLGILGSFGGG